MEAYYVLMPKSLNGGTCMALVALVMLMASSQAALADTKTLVCDNSIYPKLPPITIDIDEAGQTVIMHDNKNLGPLAAVFDSKKITFTEDVLPGGASANIWNFTIDRLTGNVSMITGSGVRFPKVYTCHVGKALF